MNDVLLEKLRVAVASGDREGAAGAAQDALASGMDPVDIFENYLVPVMDEVGEKFGRLEIFLPDLMMAADVAKAVKQVIEPAIKGRAISGDERACIVIGTVMGDVHDIGKNMVSLLLEVNGFRVVDLGTNVPVFDFIKAAEKEQAQIIAMSSLLTTSMPYMAELIKALEETGKRQNWKVVVGGGPVSPGWADSIGADGYGKDAREAIEICRRLSN
ncbi:corrinoid protein [Moorella naiadis]|uniref:cobalamin B12-binding domain-containing protein n=1 Tax=Moorella naiadis (nom. illeg.) TaxID=3093670 RepID=UPI003D9C9CAA